VIASCGSACDWRRDRRHGRALPAGSGGSCAHAAVPAVVGRDTARGGFLGKYYIFLSLIESQHYWLASLGVLYSLFGLYYYLKIANSMLVRAPVERGSSRSAWDALCSGHRGLATIVIGVFPEPFIHGVNCR